MRCSKEILQGMSETAIHPQFCRALKQMIFREKDTKSQKKWILPTFNSNFHFCSYILLAWKININQHTLDYLTELALTCLYLVLTFFLFQIPSCHWWWDILNYLDKLFFSSLTHFKSQHESSQFLHNLIYYLILK